MNVLGQYDSPSSLPQGSPRSPRVALGDFRRRSESESSNLVAGSVSFSPTSSSSSSPSATLRKKSKAKTLHRNYVGGEHVVVDSNFTTATGATTNPNINSIANAANSSIIGSIHNNNNSSSSNETISQRCRGFSQPPVVGSRLANYINTITPCASVNTTNQANGNGYFFIDNDDQYMAGDTTTTTTTTNSSNTSNGSISGNCSASNNNNGGGCGSVINDTDAVMGGVITTSVPQASPRPRQPIQGSSPTSLAIGSSRNMTSLASDTSANTSSSSSGQTQRWIVGVNSPNVMPTGVVIGDNNKFMAADGATPPSTVSSRPSAAAPGAGGPAGAAGGPGNGHPSGAGAGQGQGTWVMGMSMGASGDGSMGYLPGVNYGGFSLPETALAFSQALTALQNSRTLLDQLKAYDAPDEFVVECAARLTSNWNTILERYKCYLCCFLCF